MDMVTHNEEDPILAADELALQDLMKKNNNEWSDSCTLEEYVNGEDSIPVCMEFDSDRWDESFYHILGVMHMTRKIANEEQDESMADIEPPPLKIKTFQEAIQSLENVQHFLESQGLLQQAMSIGDAVDDVTGLKLPLSTYNNS